MSRLTIPTPDTAPAATQAQLAHVEKIFGFPPNLFRLIASSPAGMDAFLAFSGGVSKLFNVKTRERIALAVAAVNGCDYCMSAHSYMGANFAKLDEAELAANRQGHSHDAGADAAVAFGKRVAETRGKVSDADIASIRLAGYSDAQIVEIVLVVAENFLTNLLNNVAETDVDFPVVLAGAA